jgi:hypothetical protein
VENKDSEPYNTKTRMDYKGNGSITVTRKTRAPNLRPNKPTDMSKILLY